MSPYFVFLTAGVEDGLVSVDGLAIAGHPQIPRMA